MRPRLDARIYRSTLFVLAFSFVFFISNIIELPLMIAPLSASLFLAIFQVKNQYEPKKVFVSHTIAALSALSLKILNLTDGGFVVLVFLAATLFMMLTELLRVEHAPAAGTVATFLVHTPDVGGLITFFLVLAVVTGISEIETRYELA